MLLYPLSTEKAIKRLEIENKLTFVIDKKATKHDIKRETEKQFRVKVLSVNVHTKGNKKIAFIKLRPETPAIDVATRLGLI